MYYGGGSQKVNKRGSPPQYSGRGRDRDRQYFHPEEEDEDAYYEEMDYGQEDEHYGDEDAEFTGYDGRRGDPQSSQDYEKEETPQPPPPSRYSKKHDR